MAAGDRTALGSLRGTGTWSRLFLSHPALFRKAMRSLAVTTELLPFLLHPVPLGDGGGDARRQVNFFTPTYERARKSG